MRALEAPELALLQHMHDEVLGLPAAMAHRSANWPMMPSPITAQLRPSVSPTRTLAPNPYRAITATAAFSKLRLSGIFQTRQR